ncbi:MAG: GAK system CofD-like protein [Desulfovibrio sp.]|jgi:CofD-related protein of GAK system|nr:GAK system CofD-like protein [Desulfovibrio sp.]
MNSRQKYEDCDPPDAGTRIAPASGARKRLLFFSGGSALRETAREMAQRGLDTLHLVTTFDSGGSSAALRRAFDMPAVGDLRSRVMSLADTRGPGVQEIYTLFAYRLPKEERPERLTREMARLVRGSHPLIRQIPEPMSGIIREHLAWFATRMPADFPLPGANIGNMVLAAGYLRHKRRLGPVISLFSRMVRARGTVCPIVDGNAHLAVRLASGEVLCGQHRFTGKEGPPPASPIRQIWLTASLDPEDSFAVTISPRTAALIEKALALVYPMGSFYSSLVANLLPGGVGRAVAACPGPKIFVPNLGHDPELAGHSLRLQVDRLLAPMLADAPEARPRDLLTHMLVDNNEDGYPGGIPRDFLKETGVEVRSFPLVAKDKKLIDARRLTEALIT